MLHRYSIILVVLCGLAATPNMLSAQQMRCDSGALAGELCSFDDDCQFCDAGDFAGFPCAGNFDCDGQCTATFQPCQSDAGCPADLCIDNQCSESFGSCTDDNDCEVNTCRGAGRCDTSANCVVSLPVELSSFEAILDDAAVMLEWRTQSELNNAGFYVERQGAIDAGWVELAFVEGHGSTHLPRTYTYRTEEVEIGLNRFRLRQVDLDGVFEYSPEVEVTVEVPGQYVLEPAYPNPFNPTTNIRFAVASEQYVTATLHDASGKEVRQLFAGNTQSNEYQTIQLNADGIASGTYVVQVRGAEFAATQRVTLVK